MHKHESIGIIDQKCFEGKQFRLCVQLFRSFIEYVIY